MDFNNIDWVATGKLLIAVLAIIFGVSWKINRSKNNITINGNGNTTNIADRDINNVKKQH